MDAGCVCRWESQVRSFGQSGPLWGIIYVGHTSGMLLKRDNVLENIQYVIGAVLWCHCHHILTRYVSRN